MGWKTLKQHFNIGHIVHMTDAGICIGSSRSHALAVIDTVTGYIHKNEAHPNFIKEDYPALADAKPTLILSLLNTPDIFDADITVYTYKGSNIIQKHCEAPGYPNVTHDGELMYNNTFSIDKEKVIETAIEEVQASINLDTRALKDLEQKVVDLKVSLEQSSANLEILKKLKG